MSPQSRPSQGTPTQGTPSTKSPQRAFSPNTPRLITPAAGVTPGSRGVVYLTFDDGPGAYTPDVLRILSQTGSTATFFELGVRRAEYPAIAQQVQAQGNAIGNHTYDHADLTRLTAAKLRAELAGGPSARCVRPPFGATNAAVRAAIHRVGARQVLWSVDTLDWTRPGAAAIATRASAPGVRVGSIVLLHDGGGDRSQTVAALPAIIANLHARGYLVRKLPAC
jgi:peptidoglycan/xylan/chitin deacetylase (PgdA/CDA1 family)